MSMDRIEKALEEIRAGKMVILVDDEDRENEGDLVMAAEAVTPEAINFMATYGRGLICLTLTTERCAELDLAPMVGTNTSPLGTAFTVSIEAARGVTTGISAADRSHTIQVAIDDRMGAKDLSRPGHVFPLRARDGGVLVRTGQTEGSVDLARLAGMKPAGVICEIMNDDGTMARRPDLETFAAEHGLHICSVADIIDYRMQSERLVRRVREVEHEVAGLGTFRILGYQSDVDDEVHLAFVRGTWDENTPVLTRVQNRGFIDDLLGAARHDGGSSMLQRALARIAAEDQGVVLLLRTRPEPDSTTLLDRLDALGASPEPTDERQAEPAVRPDLREYGIGAQMLSDLGVHKMRLMTNTPMKIVGLEGFGITMTERVPLEARPGEIVSLNEKKGGA